MFIWFWEQVWGGPDDVLNFETEEVSRQYSDSYHYENKGLYYPTKWMEESNDYIDY